MKWYKWKWWIFAKGCNGDAMGIMDCHGYWYRIKGTRYFILIESKRQYDEGNCV